MRIQLELPEARVEELRALMAEVDIETYKELFNNALTLLDWAMQECKAQRAPASVDEKNQKYRVLVMPILERCKQAAAKNAASAPASPRTLVEA